jgi:hypothetical protein
MFAKDLWVQMREAFFGKLNEVGIGSSKVVRQGLARLETLFESLWTLITSTRVF